MGKLGEPEQATSHAGALEAPDTLPWHTSLIRRHHITTFPHQAYRVGNWREAQQWLEGCRGALTDPRTGLPRVDGPSDVLLKVMAEHGYTAPPGWRGFRELTEK